uniref:KH domain-containing protein n=1 Tax=Neospora caninum (strain Liverpool) TaxID=572307 RepID=A0A0F7UFT8_NEOCL|nr:TPA: hypothetical protein BN1204_036580 [Neospora caninum Liverpool]
MSSPPVGATGGVSPSAESSSPPPSGSSLDISELKRAAQRRLEALQAAASQSKALPSPLPSSLISASSAPGSSSFHSRTNHGLRTPAPPGSQGSMHSASFSPFPQPAFSHASDEAVSRSAHVAPNQRYPFTPRPSFVPSPAPPPAPSFYPASYVSAHAAKEMHAAAARKAAHEAMRVASLMLPKPKVEKQVLDENDTSFPEVQQLPNGLFSMDLAIATSPPASSASESCADAVASAATTVRPEAWPRLLKKETQQKIRERTGAAVLARGKPGGEGKKGLHLRITADKKATVLRGAICARDLLCSKQQLMFPPHVVVPSNFDAVAAMQGPDAEFLRHVFDISHAYVDVQGRLSQGSSAQAGANGSSLSDEPLNFAIFACTEDSLDKAVALIKWRLACVEEALRQHTDPDSFLHQKQAQKGELPKDAPQTALQPRMAGTGSAAPTEICMQTPLSDPRGSPGNLASSVGDVQQMIANSFWQTGLPDEQEMARRRREAEERRRRRRDKKGRRSRSRSRSPPHPAVVAPTRRPNKLSFAPPPDEMLSGPYVPTD